VAVAINGKVKLPVLAKKLGIPLKKVKSWKQRFQKQIKRRPLSPKKARNHLNLMQAMRQHARLRMRIKRLKTALRKG